MTSSSHRPSPPSSSASKTPSSSSFYDVLPTPYGGRGAFAKTRIPKDTTILQCQGPYASVILRKFRKEVCAWCFAWCFESREGQKGTWSVRLEGSEGQKGKGGNGGAWTPWFCGEGCRDEWVGDHSWNGEGSCLDSVVTLMNTLEKTLVTYRNAKTRSKSRAVSPTTPRPLHAFAFLDTWTPSDVSESTVDSAWKLAESLTDNLKKPVKILEMMEAWNVASAEDPTELLTEFEADCARFVLEGVLRRALQEDASTNTSSARSDGLSSVLDACSNTDASLENAKPPGLWPDLLRLQNNELQNIKSKPYMLGVFIRVYLFLKYVVHCAKPPKKKKPQVARDSTANDDMVGSPNTTTLLERLEALLQTSESVRAILARDHGNVFGIWEKGLPSADGGENGTEKEESGDDGEMFGWGMYVFGSYFNHDCTPTVRKQQQGRSLHFVTTRDIEQGEELCINYIDVSAGNGVVSRNAELSKEWFFECGCQRCKKERGALVPT